MARFTRMLAEHPALTGLALAIVATVAAYALGNFFLVLLAPCIGFGLGVALSSYVRERQIPYTRSVGTIPDGVAETARYRDAHFDGRNQGTGNVVPRDFTDGGGSSG